MADGSNWTKAAAVIGAIAALITAVTAAVTNVFGLLNKTPTEQGQSPQTRPDANQQQPDTAKPPTEALRAAEQQASAWMAAWLRRDLDELVRLSDPPFFLDQEVLLDKVQIRDGYSRDLGSEPAPTEQPRIDKIGAEQISDLKQRGWNPRSDRLMNSLRLTDDDIAVTVTSGGESVIFFFRRSGNEVKLAGMWG